MIIFVYGWVIIIIADLLCKYFNNVIDCKTVIITVVQLNIQWIRDELSTVSFNKT